MRNKNGEMVINILIGFFLGLVFLMSISLIIKYKDSKGLLKFSNSATEEDCNSTSVIFTSECLNRKLNKWYFYNISNVEKTLSLDELKSIGGVCRHAAEWYVQKAKEYGFLAHTEDFYSYDENNTAYIGHEIAVIWNKDLTEYCILDQKKVLGCNSLKKMTKINDTWEIEE